MNTGNPLEMHIRKLALSSLANKMRNQELAPLHIGSVKQNNAGMNAKLLHPAYLKNPIKSEADKANRLYKV